MTKRAISGPVVLLIIALVFSATQAQEKKLDRIRIGGGSSSATQMAMWLAREGGYYEKNGLNVEAISIPGSSLALQAMLSGELPIIQLGGAASIQANLAGADTVIIATIVKKFLFWMPSSVAVGPDGALYVGELTGVAVRPRGRRGSGGSCRASSRALRVRASRTSPTSPSTARTCSCSSCRRTGCWTGARPGALIRLAPGGSAP